jgi:HSP20 family protein
MALRVRHGSVLYASRRDPFAAARELLAWDSFAVFSPAFDVKETRDAYVLKADLPGIAEDDLDLAIHDNVLSISGSRAAEERTEGDAYSLDERPFGSFTRSFQLPELADAAQVEVTLDAGVLTLTFSKTVEARPRKIMVVT